MSQLILLGLMLCILQLCQSKTIYTNSDIIPANKCSPKTNDKVICSYWGSDQFGGLAQKTTYNLGLNISLHGVWGLESLNLNQTPDCNYGVKNFTQWYCREGFVPMLIEPNPSIKQPYCKEPYQDLNHAYHECRCHASRRGANKTTWASYLSDCESELFNKILFPVNCRFSKQEKCNYVQEWADYPLSGTGCRKGFTICNPVQNSYLYTVSSPKSCISYCYKNSTSHHSQVLDFKEPLNEEEITTIDSVSDIDDLDITTKANWPHHKDITHFEWTMIAIGIVVILVIFAIFAIVFFMCRNGRIGLSNPVSGYIEFYKSRLVKRNLIALDLTCNYRNAFNGPISTKQYKMIIGGSKFTTGELNNKFSNLNEFCADLKIRKLMNRQKVTLSIWKWNMGGEPFAHFAKGFCCLKKDKNHWLTINFTTLEGKLGIRLDTITSLKIIILDSNHQITNTIDLLQTDLQATTSHNLNSEYFKMTKQDQNTVRTNLLRRFGNYNKIYTDDHDSIRRALKF